MCDLCIIVKTFYPIRTVYLCVLNESQNKQQLFPHTTFTNYFLLRHPVCLQRGTKSVLKYSQVYFGLTFIGPCIVIYSYNKTQRDALFLYYFGKERYMFRTDLLPIIRSLNTVFTATGICHTSYVEWSTRYHSWLRHCATSRKVTGSIPNGVITIFH